MSKDEIRKLLGGYATNTLSAEEQQTLFEAAMEDQSLFDALADEQCLRELLDDPAARREIHEALQPAQPWWARALGWFRKPSHLILAGGLATAVLVTVAIRDITRSTPAAQQIAVNAPVQEQAAAPPPSAVTTQAAPQPPAGKAKESPAPPEFAKPREALSDKAVEKKADARRDESVAVAADAAKREELRKGVNEPVPAAPAPAPLAAPPTPPPPARESVQVAAQSQALGQKQAEAAKVRVAVLNVNSDQGTSTAMTKDLANKLNQAPTQYALVDQKEVDRVLAEKKLSGQPLDSQMAASVGRSLGADAVIVGNVASQQRGFAQGAAGGFRQQQMGRAKAPAKAAEQQQQAITAQVIGTENAANQFTASADNLDRIAAQLAQFKVAGAVTDVNGSVLTIDLGTPAGVKAGDRFQVRRGDQLLGELRISSATANYAVGVFRGSTVPQAGDQVHRILE